MTPELYSHPFSSYSQKVLIALYENQTPFTLKMLNEAHPENGAELARRWPLERFPILVDEGRTVLEASIIIEYLDIHYPGPKRMVLADPDAALEARTMDRFFDNFVMGPMQQVVLNSLRPEADRDPYGVAQSKVMLDKAYRWLDGVMAGRTWGAGETFGLADCSAAPSLFFADWVHPIDPAFTNARAYRARLLAHPSIAHAVDQARPYRGFFPLGAPDRD
jgi:glutathione S-transferase